MSEHVIPPLEPGTEVDALAYIAANLRPAAGYRAADSVLIFDPDLTAAEETTLAALVDDFERAERARVITLTRDEWQAIKDRIAEIRSFRTRSLATWQGLTANQREADEIRYLNDLTDVLRALLHD